MLLLYDLILKYTVFKLCFSFLFFRKISELFLLRDSTLIPNVLWFEYTNIRHEAGARARRRKSISAKSQ